MAASTLIVYPLKSVAPVVSLGVVYLPAILADLDRLGPAPRPARLARQRRRLQLLPDPAAAPLHDRGARRTGSRWRSSRSSRWSAARVAGLARAQALEAERRREEADRALAELAALSRERDRMQEEMVEAEALRRSDELKTALLRSISHDLRTPLTSIIAGGAALGSATLTEAERAELSEAIVAEGERLSRLVENLLDMSRLEAGKAEPHREPIDLAEVLDVARETRRRPRAWCGWPLDPELPTVERRCRPARACLRQPARERDPPWRRAAGHGRARGWSVTRSRSAWSTRARAYPRASGSGSSSRSSSGGGKRSGAWLGPGAGDRQGLRRGQRWRDRGRVAGRPGVELRRRLSVRRASRRVNGAARVLVCDDEPQILRALQGDPPRRRLRGGPGRQRRGGARQRRGEAARPRRSST